MSLAQYLRTKLDLLKSDYNISLEELTTLDFYYTDGLSTNCDFKLLFSENDVVIAIIYVYPDGRFFGTNNEKAVKDVGDWIKNLNRDST